MKVQLSSATENTSVGVRSPNYEFQKQTFTVGHYSQFCQCIYHKLKMVNKLSMSTKKSSTASVKWLIVKQKLHLKNPKVEDCSECLTGSHGSRRWLYIQAWILFDIYIKVIILISLWKHCPKLDNFWLRMMLKQVAQITAVTFFIGLCKKKIIANSEWCSQDCFSKKFRLFLSTKNKSLLNGVDLFPLVFG